jgi:hypothetical protein
MVYLNKTRQEQYMAGSEVIGTVLGRRLAYYRKKAKLTQQQLSDRIIDQLGFVISRPAIAAIEAAGRPGASARDRSRAERVPLVDVLAFAFVLQVPPPLLVVPLGDEDEIKFGPITMHPHLMLRWIAGDEPPSRLLDDEPASISVGREDWYEHAEPIRMFARLSELFRRAQDAYSARRSLELRGAPAEVLAKLQDVLDGALRDLDQHHREMRKLGLAVPEIAEDFADRIMFLRAIEGEGDR